jgi:hypothetical protein
MKRAIVAAAAVFATSALIGCGGGSSSSTSSGSNGGGFGGLNPTVAVSPATANVQPGLRQQFTAAVTQSADDTVTWEVNGVIGGNIQVGTIDVNGIYTAPATIPSPAAVTVTAVLNAATGFSASSILTVTSVVFSNSSLQGNYVLSLRGIDTSSLAFNAVGTITADGNGNITGGEEDLNDIKSGYAHATSVTGTYTVGSDGRGTLNLTSSLGSSSYAIALRAPGNAGLIAADNSVVNAAGGLEVQAAGVVSPSGSYAFGFAGQNSGCGPLNSIGIFGLNGGAVSGAQDENCGGTITQNQGLSGSYGSIDGLGRGAGSFSASTGQSNFVYYVVSANRYRFLGSDSGASLLGSADLQTQTSFAASDFNGPYVIADSGTSQGGIVNALIQINTSGGNIPLGYIDINDTGTYSNGNLNGAYTLSSNGYVVGTLNALSISFPFSMYLVSPSQAYYLDLRTDVTAGGTVYAQNTAMLGNLGWAGSYATLQFGYFVASGLTWPENSTAVSGQLSANGSGGLAGTLDIHDPTGVFPSLPMQGSYSVGTSVLGRASVKLTTSNGTRDYVAYIVNQGRVQMMGTDSNLTAGGDSINQF